MGKNNKGVSLIVLVITIIVIIILSGAVILNLSTNNPISQANEAKVKNDLSILKDKWNLAYMTAFTNNKGVAPTDAEVVSQFGDVPNNFSVTSTTLSYTGTDPNIIAYAPSFGITVQTDYISSKGVNKPKLVTGLTAKKWDGSNWVTVTNPDTDTTWYNYDKTNNQWANAQTADGSMWVWIPRYVYKISNLWNTSSTSGGTINVQFSQGTNDNWNSSVIGALDTSAGANASNNKWTNHPAFTFGSVELTGIWVSKFEASNSSGKIKIVPSVASWKSINMNSIFNTCRSMETDNTYGWGTSGTDIDTHLIKNVEWGAATYLAQSDYGKNGVEVWLNPDNGYITGRVGTSVSAASTSTTYAYNSTDGGKASTSGNIYGIYDMSGGSVEYTAAYIADGVDNSPSLASNGNSLLTANSKYKDVYTGGRYSTRATIYSNAKNNKKGDNICEITGVNTTTGAGWFSDLSYMPYSDTPFFMLGGWHNGGTTSGVFDFEGIDGTASTLVGFRPVLVISTGI